MTDPREPLGRLVRQVWVNWAREQPGAKASWLLGWEDLDDGQREVDMRIGEAIAVEAPAADQERCTDLLEMAWIVIANAGWDADDRDVAGRTDGWHEAAERWRDQYHDWLRTHAPGRLP